MSVLTAEDLTRHNGDATSALQEKKDMALVHLKETGSYPKNWEVHICVGKTRGVPLKFVNADDFYSRGFEYLEKCALNDMRPTMSGLVLHLGFTNRPTMEAHIRRHPDLRDSHSTFMTILQNSLEHALDEPKGQTGKIFLLKNIPEGLAPDDSVNAIMEYSWRDKTSTEHTGLNGRPLQISRDISPEEGYLMMLDGGVLEDEKLVDGEIVENE